MGEILLLLGEMFMAIIDATWCVLVMLHHGLMSVFSARHRAEFVREWRHSTVSKITLALLTGACLAWISAMAWVWIHILTPAPKPKSGEKTLALLEKVITAEDRKALLNTEKAEDLAVEGARVGIDKFKSTWKLRPSSKEAKEDSKFSKEAAEQQGSE